MSAFDILSNLVSSAPANLQPVLTQLGQIMSGLKSELTQHVVDNNSEFLATSTRLQQVAERVSALETSSRPSSAKSAATVGSSTITQLHQLDVEIAAL